MNKYIKESILWILVALPFLYLQSIWEQLPDTVPTHFNMEGKADGWSDKSSLWILPGIMGPAIYLLLLVLPKIDPKQKIRQMGDKYYMIRFITGALIAAISMLMLYSGKTGNLPGPNLILIILGAFFAGLGNYMQTMRPNYFVGIRTPWTLENETVWKKTHLLGGRIWIIGGLSIVAIALTIQHAKLVNGLFMGIVSVMVLIPVIFSFMEFRRIKHQVEEKTD